MNDVILYVEDGWTPADIIDRISGRKTVKEYAFILHNQDLDEEGNLKKAHYHVFLNYGSASTKPKDVAAWFDVKENAVEKVHSNKYRTLRYYLHLDEPDKHQYCIEDITASFDVKEYFQKEDMKVSKSDLINKCADGAITKQNFQEYIDPETYVKNSNAIEGAWEYYALLRESQAKNKRSCEVIWLYGPTGVGKTSLPVMFAEKRGLSYSITASGKDPFSNYRGEDVLIIDDIRPDSPFTFSELLKLLDPHFLTPVHARYRNKVIYSSYIFLANPYAPNQFYKMMPDKGFDDPGQLYRRITEVWELTTDRITFYKYNEEKMIFSQTGSAPNPVLSRVKELPEEYLTPANEILCSMIPGDLEYRHANSISGFTPIDDDEIDF